MSEAANYIIIDIITIITIIITIIIIINISIIIILRDKGRDSFYIIQGKRCDGASTASLSTINDATGLQQCHLHSAEICTVQNTVYHKAKCGVQEGRNSVICTVHDTVQ